MAKVKQEFTGDAKKLLAEYEKMRVAMVRLEQQQNKLAADGQKQSKSMLSGTNLQTAAVGRFNSSITSMITGYASASAALQILNNASERQNRLAEAARKTNITVGDAQAGVLKNIGDVSDENASAFLAEVSTIQNETKFQSQLPLLQAAASVLSATGGNQDKTLEIIRTAAPFFRDAQDQLAGFSGALGDVMKVTGDPNAKRGLGLMLAIQEQSRFESMEGFKNVAPAMASAVVTQKGVDKTQALRKAAALFAAIGGEMGDVEGSITKTAVANLAANLAEAFPKAGLSVLDRLAMAQQASAKVQDKIISGGFGGAILPVIEDLVRDSRSQASQATQAALAKIVTGEDIVDRKRKQLESLTGPLETATRAHSAEGNIEAFELGIGGRAAEARDILNKTLDKVAFSDEFHWAHMQRFDWLTRKGEEAQSAIDLLLEHQDIIMYGGMPNFGLKDSKNLNLHEKEQLALIGTQIQILADIRDGINRTQPNPGIHTENR